MLMNFKKNRTLSTEIEYYQEIWILKKKPQKNKKTKLKAFQIIVAFFKINSIDCILFLCRASRICSRSLSRSSVEEGELLEIIRLEVLNLLL